MVKKWLLTELVKGILLTILLEMLQFFMLIIVAKNIFLILGERPTDDIDDNVDTAEKN